jgi:hypothetical protein
MGLEHVDHVPDGLNKISNVDEDSVLLGHVSYSTRVFGDEKVPGFDICPEQNVSQQVLDLPVHRRVVKRYFDLVPVGPRAGSVLQPQLAHREPREQGYRLVTSRLDVFKRTRLDQRAVFVIF